MVIAVDPSIPRLIDPCNALIQINHRSRRVSSIHHNYETNQPTAVCVAHKPAEQASARSAQLCSSTAKLLKV